MSSSSNSVRVLKLRSSDSEIFEVEEEVAVRCVTIKNMVEDGCADNEIPLANISGNTLSMVINWCMKHADKNLKEEEELNNWKKSFFDNMDVKDDLYDLIHASNFLNEEDLLASCCQRVADLIKGKQPDEIRNLFGIENDFTPEEQKQIESEHSWAFQ